MTARPTRNETLQALNIVDAVSEKEWAALQGTIREAARLYAEMAPDTCPTCENRVRVARCRNCGGRGYVWPDTLVLRMAPFFCTGMRLHGLKGLCAVDRRRVVEMLDVLWKVGNDN